MKVLLIEPNKALAATYSTALSKTGWEIIVYLDAQAALHAADTDMPDVAVMEIQLPRHGGIEFLYEFRSYADWQSIPLILHTFVSQTALDMAQLRRLGVERYLYKPATSLLELRRAVAESAPASI